MSFLDTVLLGAIAGLTIYLGLPLGRVGPVSDRARLALAMFAVGILAFIFVDVSGHGIDIVDSALSQVKLHQAGAARLVGQFALLCVGFLTGATGISVVERRLRAKRPTGPPMSGGEVIAGDLAVASQDAAATARRSALRSGMTVAAAIGLHNLAEGLAIGVSARSGAIALATVLIIGFGVHNATEGFGIVGPLGAVKPSWRWLALAGLVGGGPTFLGTVIGYQVRSSSLELCFYALAGGAILYVIGEVWTAMRRYGHRTLALSALSLGFLVGVATDLVVSYGGG